MPRPLFVRVKDLSTRHEFDVREDSALLRKGLVERVKPVRYPPSPVPRPPKHHIRLAGQSAARSRPSPDGAGEATDKEN